MSKKPREHTLIREMRKNTENYLLLVPYSVFFIVFTFPFSFLGQIICEFCAYKYYICSCAFCQALT